uniref:Uncharacterized protein n=1 Tax=Micrurus lemniscatus lemniscatus TaxID=129467 RepID=A0A2D4J2K6_MICLE
MGVAIHTMLSLLVSSEQGPSKNNARLVVTAPGWSEHWGWGMEDGGKRDQPSFPGILQNWGRARKERVENFKEVEIRKGKLHSIQPPPAPYPQSMQVHRAAISKTIAQTCYCWNKKNLE